MAGCEDSGPPPGVGGRTKGEMEDLEDLEECGGEGGGAGEVVIVAETEVLRFRGRVGWLWLWFVAAIVVCGGGFGVGNRFVARLDLAACTLRGGEG